MMPYHTWFENMAFYVLPDGTRVQAVWVSHEEQQLGEPPAPGIAADWELHSTMRPSIGYHMNWRVRVNGTLMAEHMVVVETRPDGTIIELPDVKTVDIDAFYPQSLVARTSETDLTVADVRRIAEDEADDGR